MQGEAKRRQVLVGRDDGRQAFQDGPEVVAEEADQPAEERRRTGRDDDGTVEARDQPAGDGEGVGAGRGGLQDGDRVGGEIWSSGVALRPRAFEQGEARQVPGGLGGIDGARRGHTVGESAEPKRGARAGEAGIIAGR